MANQQTNSSLNNTGPITEQQFVANKAVVGKQWQGYIKGVLEQNGAIQGMSAEEIEKLLGHYVAETPKKKNVILKSPEANGTDLLYKKVEHKNRRTGLYEERISYSKKLNNKQKFNQKAADDMASAAMTLGWKNIKVNPKAKKSYKEMQWIAAEKKNIEALIKWELDGKDPKDFEKVINITNFKGSPESQATIKALLDAERLKNGLVRSDLVHEEAGMDPRGTMLPNVNEGVAEGSKFIKDMTKGKQFAPMQREVIDQEIDKAKKEWQENKDGPKTREGAQRAFEDKRLNEARLKKEIEAAQEIEKAAKKSVDPVANYFSSIATQDKARAEKETKEAKQETREAKKTLKGFKP